MVRYEQLKSHEVSRLRAIRLRALQDAPDAFGATFEETRARPEDDWEKQLAELPTFVAVIARLVLDVADLNVAAVALYELKGFRRNGKVGSLPPPRHHIREHQREFLLIS
jgi:hypothetical protein